jgi:hypothetical protein
MTDPITHGLRVQIARHIAAHGDPLEAYRAIERLRTYGEDVSMYPTQPAPVPRDTTADQLADEVLP